MAGPRCIVPVLITAAVALAGPRPASANARTVEPAILVAPANGAEIQAKSNPAHVMLAWKADLSHEQARFFVEVVSIASDKLSEVFASYVDRATVTVTLDDKTAQ